jgi:hypothetical protein
VTKPFELPRRYIFFVRDLVLRLLLARYPSELSKVWPPPNISVKTEFNETDLVIENFRRLRRTGDDLESKDYPAGSIMEKTWERESEGLHVE